MRGVVRSSARRDPSRSGTIAGSTGWSPRRQLGVGPKRVGEPTHVSAVLLGARGQAPIPKAIQLLGMDGEGVDAAILQTVHDRSVGDLKGDARRPSWPP